jgi:hypothetical protein
MPKYVKVQGTWKPADESADCGKIKVNGVWRAVSHSYVKVGLLWKSICSPVVTTTTIPVTTVTTTLPVTTTTPTTTTPTTTTTSTTTTTTSATTVTTGVPFSNLTAPVMSASGTTITVTGGTWNKEVYQFQWSIYENGTFIGSHSSTPAFTGGTDSTYSFTGVTGRTYYANVQATPADNILGGSSGINSNTINLGGTTSTTTSTTATTTSTTTATTTATTSAPIGQVDVSGLNGFATSATTIGVTWNAFFQQSYILSDSTGYNSGIVNGSSGVANIPGKACNTNYNITIYLTAYSAQNGQGNSDSTAVTINTTTDACPVTTTETTTTTTTSGGGGTTTTTAVTTTTQVTTSTATQTCTNYDVFGTICTGFYAGLCGGEGTCQLDGGNQCLVFTLCL